MSDRHNIDQSDFLAHKGDSWPSWQEFLKGKDTDDASVNREIEEFVNTFKNQGKYFPIKTATACQSKWTWNTIFLNRGESGSCHRSGWEPIDVNNFNHHNGPVKLKERRMMLSGKWPGNGCEYCRDIELAGGHSDRQHNNLIPGLNPPELETNPTEIAITPRLQEVYASNVCNLACVYCSDSESSKIERENDVFGDFSFKGVTIKNKPTTKQDMPELYEKFFVWLRSNIKTIRRLHLLGGETFIQHKFMNDILSLLEEVGHKELRLCIFSNMNAPEKHWSHYIERIKQLPIEGFDLTASIDCWGEQASYVRSGLNLEMFEERLAWASEQDDWLRLNVNQTITNMTIKTMPELIRVINKYNVKKHIGQYFEFQIGTLFQHPKIYAYNMWENDFKNIYAEMKQLTTEQCEVFLRLEGLEKQLQTVTAHDYEQIENLHIYLDELDRRRGTDWRSLFPYLIV